MTGLVQTRWGSSLVTLVAAAVMPIVLSGAVAVYLLIDRQLSLMEAELRSSAGLLLTAVEQELDNQVNMVRTLAAAPALDRHDLQHFHEVATRLQQANPQWAAVVLDDPQATHQLVHTLRPFGEPLAGSTEPDSILEVARTGRPALGPPVAKGRVIDEPFIAVRVPAVRDGQVRYVVSAALRPSRLAEIVARTGESRKGGLAGVFDPDFTIVAHSHRGHQVGQPASESLRQAAARTSDGLVESVTRDGTAVVTALRRSPSTGWWVAVASPKSAVVAPLYNTAAIVALSGAAATVLSLALAVVIGRNIRQRAHQEDRESAAQLTAMQQRLLRMANMAPCFVWTCGADGAATWVNDRWLDHTGLQRRDAAGLGRLAAIHPDDVPGALGWFARTDLDALDFELRIGRHDGTYHWHRAKAQALRTDDGRFVEWIGVTVDIDAAKAVESALQEYARLQALARAEADYANRAKSRFLAAASHDLRQPFQAMHLYHAVLDGCPIEPPARRAIDGLRQAMDAGEELLKALLDVSSFEAGTVRPAIASFAIAEVIDDVVAEYRGIAAQQGLLLRGRTAEVEVASDRILLKRMVRNLVSNALRYTRRGGILVTCRRHGGQALVQVWDTGIGIDEAELKLIFEDFYQVDNPSRDRNRGLGLGLSIVQRTARLLDHEIAVTSRLGRGSVFSIRVPAAAVGEDTPRDHAPLLHA